MIRRLYGWQVTAAEATPLCHRRHSNRPLHLAPARKSSGFSPRPNLRGRSAPSLLPRHPSSLSHCGPFKLSPLFLPSFIAHVIGFCRLAREHEVLWHVLPRCSDRLYTRHQLLHDTIIVAGALNIRQLAAVISKVFDADSEAAPITSAVNFFAKGDLQRHSLTAFTACIALRSHY